MSETEFDSYLSLLAKFLKLRSRQRAELADELRDHLDARLDELLAQGKSRDQAIKIALEEFGDAAVLAEDFSRIASRRTRRFVMRCTAASAAVVAAVVLLSIAFAPPGPNGPGLQHVIAQSAPDGVATAQDAEVSTADSSNERSIEQQATAELDRKLGQLIADVKFTDTPLKDVVAFVADAVEADMLIDQQALEEEAVTADEPVTLSFTRTKLSAGTVLDFVLQPHDLAFVNRAGVIYITTQARADERLTTKVYNVRDLLENATSHASAMPPAATGLGGDELEGGGSRGGVGGGGFFSVRDALAAAMMSNVIGQFGGGKGGQDGAGMGGVGQAGTRPRATGPAADLLTAIQQTTSGPWLEIDGTGGTMSLFNGLLVIRQTDDVHTEVQKLLDALREAGAKQPGGSVTVPKGGEADSNQKTANPPTDSPNSLKPSSPTNRDERNERSETISKSPLGMTTVTLSKDEWSRFQIPPQAAWSESDLKVIEVIPGSTAANAGITIGDVITNVQAFHEDADQPLSFTDALSTDSQQLRKGYQFVVLRQLDGKVRPFEVIIDANGKTRYNMDARAESDYSGSER